MYINSPKVKKCRLKIPFQELATESSVEGVIGTEGGLPLRHPQFGVDLIQDISTVIYRVNSLLEANVLCWSKRWLKENPGESGML
ncbi:hypothetical protein HYDPIDRAFT_118638 [Hydnomerulius pinastri MD-312]|uniref:Uncharacterized protein n=1 Tax=Hydnomerulius pinastri MD-312 TaxID=994086 RepID=A0A0C9W8F1_9AGAM|nr:hypothetical protein HYDPIDRAFT_118638 [Hydnomerulius pinastri MD-312]